MTFLYKKIIEIHMKMHAFMVSENVLDYFKELAQKYDRTASELYRKALDEFIERERKKCLAHKSEQTAE